VERTEREREREREIAHAHAHAHAHTHTHTHTQGRSPVHFSAALRSTIARMFVSLRGFDVR
jgi:ABC-type Zn2+ transport system substrate-binding protein/surface adhesin